MPNNALSLGKSQTTDVRIPCFQMNDPDPQKPGTLFHETLAEGLDNGLVALKFAVHAFAVRGKPWDPPVGPIEKYFEYRVC